jgi:hypothetical protein
MLVLRSCMMVAYAVLRLRGRSPEVAAKDLLMHRYEGRIVPAYRKAVEEWVSARGPAPHGNIDNG